MNQLTQIPALLPILPEIVLACGAMLMLMVGVSIPWSARNAAIVNAWCIALLIAAAGILLWLPAGRTV